MKQVAYDDYASPIGTYADAQISERPNAA